MTGRRQGIAPGVGAALLAMTTLAVYASVVRFEFIGFDDPIYVTANPHVTRGLTAAGLRWAATALHGANWHPLTWVSHMTDVAVWGLWPGGHHLTSVVLHVAATMLCFVALARLTGAPARSLVVAALFALHPTRVESVAWVSERKDVLAALFWFATLVAYASYVESTTRARYALVVALYTLGLLAKPMLVTLPCTLLLLDYWPLARLGPGRTTAAARVVAEKIPLFVLAAAASVMTVVAQRAGGAVVALEPFPLAERVAHAAVVYLRYLAMLAWPSGLAFFYPLTPVSVGRGVAAGLVLVAVTVACVWRARRQPYLLVGWLWFVGTLVPVIGLVQVGQQDLADRFTYVPAVGVFVAVVWWVGHLLAAARASRWIAATAATGVLVIAAAGTVAQAQYWRDGESLFRRSLTVTTDNYVAHMNLGHLETKRKRWDLAEPHYREAARIKPNLATAWSSLGNVHMAQGHDADARADLERAIALDPSLPEAHNSLGLMAARAGDVAAARASFERAIALRPEYVAARANLGDVLARTGDAAGAIAQYRRASSLAPDDGALAHALGLALLSAGDAPGAVAALASARAHAPDDAQVADALGTARLMAGDTSGAIEALRAAVALDPGSADAHHHLAAALGTAGRVEEAVAEVERTLALDPRLVEAHRTAAITLARAGRADEARTWLERGAMRARELGNDAAAAELAAAAVRVGSQDIR
jgi:tetratricopeptide (TPR) repeat protein